MTQGVPLQLNNLQSEFKDAVNEEQWKLNDGCFRECSSLED